MINDTVVCIALVAIIIIFFKFLFENNRLNLENKRLIESRNKYKNIIRLKIDEDKAYRIINDIIKLKVKLRLSDMDEVFKDGIKAENIKEQNELAGAVAHETVKCISEDLSDILLFYHNPEHILERLTILALIEIQTSIN